MCRLSTIPPVFVDTALAHSSTQGRFSPANCFQINLAVTNAGCRVLIAAEDCGRRGQRTPGSVFRRKEPGYGYLSPHSGIAFTRESRSAETTSCPVGIPIPNAPAAFANAGSMPSGSDRMNAASGCCRVAGANTLDADSIRLSLAAIKAARCVRGIFYRSLTRESGRERARAHEIPGEVSPAALDNAQRSMPSVISLV